MNRPNAMTLKELKKQVDAAVKAGHGDKTVLISGDDEGNTFHLIWYDLCTDEKNIEVCIHVSNSTGLPPAKDCVMLG